MQKYQTTSTGLVMVALVWVFPMLSLAQVSKTENGATDKKSTTNYQEVASELFLIRGNQPLIEHLELVDFQYDSLMEMQRELREGLRGLVREISGRTAGEREQVINKFYKRYHDRMKEILLPHQSERLRQVAIQSYGQKSGLNPSLGVLNHPAVQRELGINPELMKQLDEKAKEVNEKLAGQIKELKAKAKAEVLSLLSQEQRSKLDDLVGEEFNFDTAPHHQRERERDDDE